MLSGFKLLKMIKAYKWIKRSNVMLTQSLCFRNRAYNKYRLNMIVQVLCLHFIMDFFPLLLVCADSIFITRSVRLIESYCVYVPWSSMHCSLFTTMLLNQRNKCMWVCEREREGESVCLWVCAHEYLQAFQQLQYLDMLSYCCGTNVFIFMQMIPIFLHSLSRSACFRSSSLFEWIWKCFEFTRLWNVLILTNLLLLKCLINWCE